MKPDIRWADVGLRALRPWSQPKGEATQYLLQIQSRLDLQKRIPADLRFRLDKLVAELMTVIPWTDDEWEVVRQVPISVLSDGSHNACATVVRTPEFYGWRRAVKRGMLPRVPRIAFVTVDFWWLTSLELMNESWIQMRAVIGDLEHGRVNDEVTVTYQSFLERMRVLPQMNVGMVSHS